MITLAEIAARVVRLDALADDLTREADESRTWDDLTQQERDDYLGLLLDAVRGLRAARTPLILAHFRLSQDSLRQ